MATPTLKGLLAQKETLEREIEQTKNRERSAAVAKVRELNPKVIIAEVPDVGHLIRFDSYPAFKAALWSFLQQVSVA